MATNPTVPRAYPRSHGATARSLPGPKRGGGLSPLARGNQWWHRARHRFPGPIPARTGQPLIQNFQRHLQKAYPRSHGATCRSVRTTGATRGLSPLARGNPTNTAMAQMPSGPIPARTGQPELGGFQLETEGAYPRSHGATCVWWALSTMAMGLSPLARGNHERPRQAQQRSGPIPARTGQPSKTAFTALA